MTNNDRIIGTIRTGVPALWGLIITWLVGKIPAVADVIAAVSAWAGQDVQGLLGLAFTALVIAGYYWVARELGARWPWLEAWLVGRSVVPIYDTAGVYVIPAPTPEQEADLRGKR